MWLARSRRALRLGEVRNERPKGNMTVPDERIRRYQDHSARFRKRFGFWGDWWVDLV
jgi:hypothetical protein